SLMSLLARNGNTVLLGAAQPSVASGVGRVRSLHPRNGKNGEVAAGLVLSLGKSPEPAHCEVLVNPATGAPVASRQGAFKSGSTMPKLVLSRRCVFWKLRPPFTLWIPFTYERSERKPALVSPRSWLTVSCWIGPKSAN